MHILAAGGSSHIRNVDYKVGHMVVYIGVGNKVVHKVGLKVNDKNATADGKTATEDKALAHEHHFLEVHTSLAAAYNLLHKHCLRSRHRTENQVEIQAEISMMQLEL